MFTPEGRALATRVRMIKKLYDDSIGVCWFSTMGVDGIADLTGRALMAATGWKDFSVEEAHRIGERIINLMQAFSVRFGHTPAHDLDIGGRWLEPPESGVAKGLSIAPHLKYMIRDYYTVMGWDPETGKPLTETLTKLGLEKVAGDIAKIKVPVRLQDVPFETPAQPEQA
jgi:aldehyde:ferredoxin oxidoreductase